MRRVEVPSYPVTVFVAGADVEAVCQAYCDEIGLCVTITPSRYVFTDGGADGWAIGFINYGRFPSSPTAIFAKAEVLAQRLIEGSGGGIESATIQAPDKTVWLSARPKTIPQAGRI